MISTLEGLLVAILALVPGATAVVTYRRFNNGKISLVSTNPDSFSDRVVAYTIFSILFAPLTLVLAAAGWDYWFEVRTPDNPVSRLHRDDWEWWALAINATCLSVLYLAVPALGGAAAAKVAKTWRKKYPPETVYATAWDTMFVRLTKESDTPTQAALLRWRVAGDRPVWKAGAFGKKSTRASSQTVAKPHANEALLLTLTLVVSGKTQAGTPFSAAGRSLFAVTRSTSWSSWHDRYRHPGS